jgi:hypothetical protein
VELRNETIGMDRKEKGGRGESDPAKGQQDRQQGVCERVIIGCCVSPSPLVKRRGFIPCIVRLMPGCGLKLEYKMLRHGVGFLASDRCHCVERKFGIKSTYCRAGFDHGSDVFLADS